jgi:hypothetical protein
MAAQTFTVFNTGSSSLTVTSIKFNDPYGCTHVADLTNFGGSTAFTSELFSCSTPLAVGASKTFTNNYLYGYGENATRSGTITVNGTAGLSVTLDTAVIINIPAPPPPAPPPPAPPPPAPPPPTPPPPAPGDTFVVPVDPPAPPTTGTGGSTGPEPVPSEPVSDPGIVNPGGDTRDAIATGWTLISVVNTYDVVTGLVIQVQETWQNDQTGEIKVFTLDIGEVTLDPVPPPPVDPEPDPDLVLPPDMIGDYGLDASLTTDMSQLPDGLTTDSLPQDTDNSTVQPPGDFSTGVPGDGGLTVGGTVSGTTIPDGTDSSCPDPNTLILTSPTSSVPAGSLVVGDYIYTAHETTRVYGYYKVLHAEIVEQQPKLCFTFEDGSNIIVSTTHRFLMSTNLWDSAFNLVASDSVASIDGNKTIVDITPVGRGPVVKFEIEDAHTYISAGLISHNVKTTTDTSNDASLTSDNSDFSNDQSLTGGDE